MQDIHLLTLDTAAAGGNLARAVEALIRRSRRSAYFKPGQAWEIDGTARLDAIDERWRWWRHERIIGGRLDNQQKQLPAYDGWETGLDEQIALLMQRFHWAVFSYFTTFHGNIATFVTTERALVSALLQEGGKPLLLEGYRGLPPLLPHLKYVSFYDYGEEGWLPYELAREKGEALPLILTSVDPDHPEYYHRYDYEKDEQEDYVWYEAPMRRLELVREIRIPTDGGGQVLCRVHRATDLDAYLELWSMASRDCGIADATLAADCDLGALEKLLRKTGRFDVIEHTAVAKWAYGQCYGGGADEHHAVFHSRDAARSHRIWQQAGQDGISRF